MTPGVLAFIQARMSSSRFPGKVLAPLHGRPVLQHVVSAASQALGPDHVVILTSEEPSDDPVWVFGRHLGVAAHRGPLQDVVERFRGALERFPCEGILRLCADSPFISPIWLERLLMEWRGGDHDLVTTVWPRSFPRGHNAEIFSTASFSRVASAARSPDEREHVTAYYYEHPEQFRILNVSSGHPEWARRSLAVDTPEDLRSLEGCPEARGLMEAALRPTPSTHAWVNPGWALP